MNGNLENVKFYAHFKTNNADFTFQVIKTLLINIMSMLIFVLLVLSLKALRGSLLTVKDFGNLPVV